MKAVCYTSNQLGQPRTMLFAFAVFALCWASLLPAVIAAVVGDVSLQTRDDTNNVDAVAKALRAATLNRRDNTYTMNQTSLSKSWANATLFSTGIRHAFFFFACSSFSQQVPY